MIEPLACVAWGLKQIETQPGDSAVIFGAGPMGCLLVQALKHTGASQVVVTDVVPWRLELASALGATQVVLADPQQTKNLLALQPDGFDIVADATGIPAVLERSFEFVKPRGKVWVFGVAPRETTITVKPYDVFRKDLKIIGSFAVNRTFPQAIAMIRNGAVRVEPLVSHQLPLNEFNQGIELAQTDPKRLKIQFEI